MNRVLVTGGAGFLGSHLVDRLIALGNHVVVVDNLLTGRVSNLESAIASGNCTFVFGDVTMPLGELRTMLEKTGTGKFTRIYHLASPASPEAYGAHPWETLAVNGTATMSLIDLALEHQALFFFASTSEVYGDPLVHPQPETYFGNVNPIGPRACYDEGKRFGEAAVSVAASHRGLDARIMRVFNCYGPRMDYADGRVLPAFLSALRDGKPFPIHGDGMQTRSMTYVDDLVEGILALSDYKHDRLTAVNLGSEDERTVLDIGRALAKVANAEFTIEHLEERPEDPRRRRPITKLARELGWQAETKLEDGLAKTWAGFKEASLVYA